LKIDPGQYVNIWIPSASFWSIVQTHPFTVVSWSHKPQDHLDLFIKRRKGFTNDLYSLSEYGPTTSIVMFTGPHGQSFSTDKHETIIMIATGFGIAAHLPYLKKLIYDHHMRKIPLRRLHLIWQIEDIS
jgi:NAD(P)H-flavin reductase